MRQRVGRARLKSIDGQEILLIVFVDLPGCGEVAKYEAVDMFEEEDVTGPNIAMDNLDVSEVLAALQYLLEEGQLLSKRPLPVCLPSVLSDLEEGRVGPLEQQHQNLLIWIHPIHKRILKGEKEISVFFADFLLMHPYLLQPFLEC